MSERLHALLLRAYPVALREEYGAEMLVLVQELRGRREYCGRLGGIRLATFLMSDVLRTLADQRIQEIRARRARSPRMHADSPPYMEAAIAGLAVLVLYIV